MSVSFVLSFMLAFDKAMYTIGMYDEVYDRSEICATFVDVQKILYILFLYCL